MVFTKADDADPTQAANQDRLTSNVWLTRGGNRGLYNIAKEAFFTHSVSPADTEWASGTTANYASLTYTDWETWARSVGNPPSTPGVNAVLHLKTDDIYLDIKFIFWSMRSGGFSYERSTPGPINGNCGSANGGTFTTVPTANLCSAGTASAVSGSGPWTWSCTGSSGGTTANCSANLQTWTVTPSAGAGGTISPSTPVTVNHGSATTFTVTPDSDHTASVGGTCGGSLAGSTYTTAAITNACTVTASFTLLTPTCILTASPSTINAGQSSTLTATCSPAATSYAWTNTGFASTVSTGNVAPTLTTTYFVIGSNAAGAGNSASATVTVTQCTYALSPTSLSVPLGGINATLNVTSPAGCAWTASSNADWITITAGGSGAGNGTVSYMVAANTNGAPRTGTLTIGGETFTVTQAGIAVPACTLTSSADTINLGASVILTATCSPPATGYTWTPAAGLVAGPTNTATATPPAVGIYQYSVAGTNPSGVGNTANVSVTVTMPVFTSASDCFFDWAEIAFPGFFAPAGGIPAVLTPYYFRYYSLTNAYLATSSGDSHLYYLGPLSNNLLFDLGALSGWLTIAGCQ